LPVLQIEAVVDAPRAGVIGESTVDEVHAKVLREGMRDWSWRPVRPRFVIGFVGLAVGLRPP
jgi:hypothetical protein